MELSILLAKIISVIYISSGVAVLIGTFKISDFIIEFEKSSTLPFLSGCIGIIFGMILINYHNIWVGYWPILITIISWIMLIGGIVVLIIPKTLFYMKNLIIDTRLLGIFMILLGIVFGYFGFVA